VYSGSFVDATNPGKSIAPALAIEWDAVSNQEYLDSSDRSIHIMQVCMAWANIELARSYLMLIDPEPNFSFGGQFIRCIHGTHRSTIFSGNDFTTGYSAATGLFADYHDIMSWDLTQTSSSLFHDWGEQSCGRKEVIAVELGSSVY
jgi:hypothetical protein